jgi:hypothetical protein
MLCAIESCSMAKLLVEYGPALGFRRIKTSSRAFSLSDVAPSFCAHPSSPENKSTATCAFLDPTGSIELAADAGWQSASE